MAGTEWDAATAGPGVQVNADGTAERPTAGGGSNYAGIRANAGRSKGKRFFEIDATNTTCSVGVVDVNADVDTLLGSGSDPSQWGFWIQSGSVYYRDTAGTGTEDKGTGGIPASIMGILVDFDAKAMTLYSDGVELFTHALNFANDTELFPAVSMGASSTGIELQTVEPFAYPPAVSFIAWDKPDSALGSKVSGVINYDSSPVARLVRAFSFERLTYDLDGETITESKPLGQTISNAADGAYEIILRNGFPRDVFVVAFDDWGEPFHASEAVSVGDRVRPSENFAGLVYECDGSGNLPATEPNPWPSDDTQSHIIGTASFQVRALGRPMVHGPVTPDVVIIEGPKDEFFDNVTALLHFDGNNGSVDIVDIKGNSWSISGSGVSLSSLRAKFGDTSLYLGGSGHISLGGGAVFGPGDPRYVAGSEDFTLEAWIWIDSTDSSYRDIIVIDKTYDGLIRYGSDIGFYTGSLGFSARNPAPVQQWVHVAAVRSQGTITTYVNGSPCPTPVTSSIPVTKLFVGASTSGSERFIGNIDDVRITKGIARYTAPFTPTDKPFPDEGE